MFENIEELKNKIIYRASYRGSKEMDILMTNFTKSLIFDDKLRSVYDLGNFHNRSKIVFIFFFFNKFVVFTPTPLRAFTSDNKYS